MEQIREEEEYVQNIKGLYILLAILSLVTPFINFLNEYIILFIDIFMDRA